MLSACCVLAPITSHATTSQTLTLQTAIEKTLKQNPQLHQFTFTRQRLLSEREKAKLKPAYHVEMEVENIAGTGDLSGFDGAELTVALSSVIELGSKRQSRTTIADAKLELSDLERKAQTLDVLGELTSAFIHLLSTQHALTLAEEATGLSKATLSSVQNRAQRGAVSDAEVIRSKARLSQSKLRRDNLHRRMERQRISLARFWGETIADFSTVEGDLFAFGNSQSFSTLYEQVKQSPAMTVFASEYRLKDAEIRLAQTQDRADVSWQLGIKRLEESNDSGLMLGFSMPLSSKNRNRSVVKATIATRNALEFRQANQLLVLHEQLFSAYSQREQFIEYYRLLSETIIPQLKKALEITREAYDRGRLKYQDWMISQQELLNAKQQLIETATNALLNQALIEQLTAEPLTEQVTTID